MLVFSVLPDSKEDNMLYKKGVKFDGVIARSFCDEAISPAATEVESCCAFSKNFVESDFIPVSTDAAGAVVMAVVILPDLGC